MGPNGLLGHTGTDGSNVVNRIDRYGNWFGIFGENLQYGVFSLGLSQTKSISNQVHMAMKSACFGSPDSQKNGYLMPAAMKAW